jgi:hypothetical protein
MAKNNEVAREVSRYLAQQKRSKKRQAEARRKGAKEDRSENINKVIDDAGTEALIAGMVGVGGSLAGMVGGALAAPAILSGGRLTAQGVKLLARSKAGRAILKKLKDKVGLKVVRTKPKVKRSRSEAYEDALANEERVTGAVSAAGTAAGGATGVKTVRALRDEKQKKKRDNRRKSTGIKGY